MDAELLSLLRCPETQGMLRPAERTELDRINAAIRNSTLKNRSGDLINEPVEECLVCDSAGLCYPVRDGLPVMLPGEAFNLPR